MSSKDDQSSSTGEAPSNVPQNSSSSSGMTSNGQESRLAEDLIPSASNGQARSEKVDVHEAYSEVRDTLGNLTSSMNKMKTKMERMRGIASSLEKSLAVADEEVRRVDGVTSSLEQFVTNSKKELDEMEECAEKTTNKFIAIKTFISHENAKRGKRQTESEVIGTPAKQRKESENVPAERLEEGETSEAAVKHLTTPPCFDKAPIVEDELNQEQMQEVAELGEQRDIDPKPVVEEQLAIPPVTAALDGTPSVVENQFEKLGHEGQVHPKPVIEVQPVEVPVAAAQPKPKTSNAGKKGEQKKVHKGKEARRRAQAEKQEAEELAERQVIAEKAALGQSIQRYVDRQFRRVPPIYYGVLKRSPLSQYMCNRHEHYKKLGDTKMSLMFMLLNENEVECILQDMYYLSEKSKSLNNPEKAAFLEKRYYQRVTTDAHPDVESYERENASRPEPEVVFGLLQLDEDMEMSHTSMAGNTRVIDLKKLIVYFFQNQVVLRLKSLETIDKTEYDEIELLLLEKHHEFKDEVANWTQEQAQAVFAERSAHYRQSNADDKEYCSALFKCLASMSAPVMKLDAFFINGVLNKRFHYDQFEKKYILAISSAKHRPLENEQQGEQPIPE